MNPKLKALWERYPDWLYKRPPGAQPFAKDASLAFTNIDFEDSKFTLCSVACQGSQVAVIQFLRVLAFQLEEYNAGGIGDRWVPLESPAILDKCRFVLERVEGMKMGSKDLDGSNYAGFRSLGEIVGGQCGMPPVVGVPGSSPALVMQNIDFAAGLAISTNGGKITAEMRGYVVTID